VVRVAELDEHLTCYHFGTGAVCASLLADSAAQIRRRFPDLRRHRSLHPHLDEQDRLLCKRMTGQSVLALMTSTGGTRAGHWTSLSTSGRLSAVSQSGRRTKVPRPCTVSISPRSRSTPIARRTVP